MRMSDWSSDVCSSELRPSDGRTGAVTPVTGEDRCDAAKQDKDKARQEACAKVIETRAAEFTRPDPTILSPEQRLLVDQRLRERSEEHTSELQSLMRISYAVFCLKKKTTTTDQHTKSNSTNKLYTKYNHNNST